jgi:DUF971 family protein
MFITMLTPKAITKPKPYLLRIEWNDTYASTILLETLRDQCPCAECTGEEILGQKVFVGIKMFKPGMNELTALTPVGNYGLQATWQDGHATGIYTWQNLRAICETHGLTAEQLTELASKE